MVEVGLRAYAATYEGSTITWDDKTQIATVTYNGVTLSVKSIENNNRNGSIYVDDSLFIDKFGVGNAKLVVYQEGDNVSIRVNFNISGKAADNTIQDTNDTYANAFIKGIVGEASKGTKVKINLKLGISNASWHFLDDLKLVLER